MKLTDTPGHGSNSGDFLVFISLYQPPFRQPQSELNLYLYYDTAGKIYSFLFSGTAGMMQHLPPGLLELTHPNSSNSYSLQPGNFVGGGNESQGMSSEPFDESSANPFYRAYKSLQLNHHAESYQHSMGLHVDQTNPDAFLINSIIQGDYSASMLASQLQAPPVDYRSASSGWFCTNANAKLADAIKTMLIESV